MDTITQSRRKAAAMESAISSVDLPAVSLFNGKGGLLLFYYHLYISSGEEAYYQKCSEIARQLMQEVSREIRSFSYCDGLAGIACLFQYLKEKAFIDDSIDHFLEQCDEILLSAFMKMGEQSNWDYLHGASGIALYFAERKIPATDTVAEVLIDGITQQLAEWSAGCTNCGMAHGWTGILMILTRFADHSSAVILMRKVIDQLLQCRTDNPASLAVFPSIVQMDAPRAEWKYEVPLGWCYGDTTVSIGLYQAAQVLQDSSLMAQAEAIALHATQRTTKQTTFIYDACFCHGSASVAHIFKKWYHFTGNTAFHDSYLFWINQTLDLTTFEDGVGGFKKFAGDTYKNMYGLLDGAAGVAMVLNEVSGNETIDWDRFFLLS